MSRLTSIRLDMSLPSDGPDDSAGTLADLSVGSLGSLSFLSPPRSKPKLPSVSTAPSSATPPLSQPIADAYSRLKTDVTTTPVTLRRTSLSDDPDGDGAELEAQEEPATPIASRAKRGQSSIGASKGGVSLTLREQEKVRESILKLCP